MQYFLLKQGLLSEMVLPAEENALQCSDILTCHSFAAVIRFLSSVSVPRKAYLVLNNLSLLSGP
jgi:hypothetical protein